MDVRIRLFVAVAAVTAICVSILASGCGLPSNTGGSEGQTSPALQRMRARFDIHMGEAETRGTTPVVSGVSLGSRNVGWNVGVCSGEVQVVNVSVGYTMYDVQARIVQITSGVTYEDSGWNYGNVATGISSGWITWSFTPSGGQGTFAFTVEVSWLRQAVECNIAPEEDYSPGGGSQQFSVDDRGMTSVLIGLRADQTQTGATQSVERLGGRVTTVFRFVHGLAAEVPYARLGDLVRAPQVAYIEPNATVSIAAQILPWGIDRVDAERVWGGAEDALHVSVGSNAGQDVKVAVVDTGIDLGHSDLQVSGGCNAINSHKPYDDDNGHGTMVAGMIGARDNDIGVIGVAPSCRLYGVKVLDRNGNGFVSDIVSGIEWCISPTDGNGNPLPEGPMDIINMSLGASADVATLKAACNSAWNNPSHPHGGAVLVGAAGNDGLVWPANYGSVISVGATDQYDQLGSFSAVGPPVELSAPGVQITSTYKGNLYATGDGTSFSAPHVSGVAALLYATGRYTSAARLRQHLRDTVEDLGSPGRDQMFGYGLVDALTAVVDEGCSDILPRALFCR